MSRHPSSPVPLPVSRKGVVGVPDILVHNKRLSLFYFYFFFPTLKEKFLICGLTPDRTCGRGVRYGDGRDTLKGPTPTLCPEGCCKQVSQLGVWGRFRGCYSSRDVTTPVSPHVR